MTTIAIIPARGGSKGIVGKNLVDLNGKPLIDYTLAAAKEANVIDQIFVSTDDEDIADDVTLDVLEFDEFDPWEAPPKPITMKKLPEESVEDRIKQTEIKNPIQTKKELVFVKRESTYKGSYWQNDKYLYVSPHHPEWRPIFQFKD